MKMLIKFDHCQYVPNAKLNARSYIRLLMVSAFSCYTDLMGIDLDAINMVIGRI